MLAAPFATLTYRLITTLHHSTLPPFQLPPFHHFHHTYYRAIPLFFHSAIPTIPPFRHSTSFFNFKLNSILTSFPLFFLSAASPPASN
jgi:hypothetical protein